MAFDPTTPYAVACLSDSGKSAQSLSVLRQQAPLDIRVQNLVALVTSWNVSMDHEEAQQVVKDFDRVMAEGPKAANIVGGSYNFNGFSSASEGS